MTIRAMIFDLDGTLVQTEKLKALSYAHAVEDLCSVAVTENEVFEAYKDVVGLPRQQVAQALMERFSLETKASERMEEFQVSTPWQAFIQIRLKHYNAMLGDKDLIRAHQWPHNLEVLQTATVEGCKTGLATMSRCTQANQVLTILDLSGAFDFVATRDDVELGKPNPEIYQLVSRELAVIPEECLVLEDSPSGVEAALAAGMYCIAVTTPFTRESIPATNLLESEWIVQDPTRVSEVVRQRMKVLRT